MKNIKQRLKSNSPYKRIDALFDAFELGIRGIDLIIPSLQDKNSEVREAALLVLSESNHHTAIQAVFNYWLSQIDHLHTIDTVLVNTKILPSYFVISDFNKKLVCYWELDYKRAFVQLWDLKTGKSDNHSDLGTHWLRLGNQGKVCIVNFQDCFRFLNLYDPDINKYRSPKDEYVSGINMCADFTLCPNKKSLAASGTSEEIKIRDYKNNRYNMIYTIDRGLRLSQSSVINIWKKEVLEIGKRLLEDISALIFTPDDKFLICNLNKGPYPTSNQIKIWHTETGELIKTIDRLPLLAITSLGISSDDKIIACGIREDKICVWELVSDLIIYSFDEITPCILSDDGRVLIHAIYDYQIIIRDLIANKTLNILQGHTAPISHLAMSTDRKFIASYDQENTIKVWGIA